MVFAHQGLLIGATRADLSLDVPKEEPIAEERR
jgi:hypothetical protein